MDEHLGYEKTERSDSDDYRNGYKSKRVTGSYGALEIDLPQDRKSTFDPKVVRKRQKDISDVDQKINSMYATGMTTRQMMLLLLNSLLTFPISWLILRLYRKVNVWRTRTDYLQMNKVGNMASELNSIFAEDKEAMKNTVEFVKVE